MFIRMETNDYVSAFLDSKSDVLFYSTRVEGSMWFGQFLM